MVLCSTLAIWPNIHLSLFRPAELFPTRVRSTCHAMHALKCCIWEVGWWSVHLQWMQRYMQDVKFDKTERAIRDNFGLDNYKCTGDQTTRRNMMRQRCWPKSWDSKDWWTLHNSPAGSQMGVRQLVHQQIATKSLVSKTINWISFDTLVHDPSYCKM